MEDETVLFWCEKCRRVLEREKIEGLSEQSPEKIPSLTMLAPHLRCGYCGTRGLGSGVLREVANLPKLVLLGVLLVVGLLGSANDSVSLQWLGFGIPAAHFLYGVLLRSNLRWLFTQWVVEPEPDWYARKFEPHTHSFGFGFLHTNFFSLIAIAAFLLNMAFGETGFSSPSEEIESTAGETTAAAVFRDEVNGYFAIVPPVGWDFERTRDARTKVTWRQPESSNVLVRVIARRATETTSEVMRGVKNTASRQQAAGIKTRFHEETLGSFRTAVVDQWPGRGFRSRIILFVDHGVHFNIQYAAPSEALFEQYEDEVSHALETIVALPGNETGAGRVEEEELSWYRRYSFLLMKLGETKAGQALASEGLAKYPDDPELSRLVKDSDRDSGSVRP